MMMNKHLDLYTVITKKKNNGGLMNFQDFQKLGSINIV